MSTSPKKGDKASSKDKPPKKDSKEKDTKSKKSKDTAGAEKKKKSKVDTSEAGGAAADTKSKKSDKKSQLNQSQSDISFFKPPLFLQPQPPADQSICPYHKDKNLLFCELCEQPGCQNCTLYGPHNTQMHRVSKLEDCYKARYLYLNELVCGKLIQKRDFLAGQIAKLNEVGEELRYRKYGVEKLTKIEFGETLDRLKGVYGGKLAVLHLEMAELQKDLEAINALGSQFFDLTSMNPETFTADNNPKGMIPFLLRTKFLQDQAQNLIAKPIKTSIDIYPYDLPREVAERKLLIQSNQTNSDIVGFKNQVIWRLVEEKKAISNSVVEQFYEEANQERQQWTKLTNKLREQLDSFRMSCAFCGIVLLPTTINQPCPQNTGTSPTGPSGQSLAPPQHTGSGFHYFSHK